MDLRNSFFTKKLTLDLLLLVSSFAIYFFYFHSIFLNLNSILSSITLDSLKNYYTFVYHIKNDVDALTFSGLNYPYGEHVVYTDCQPIFTFILRALPFTHNYLIGILHSLMFLSFIVSPLILLRIFRLLGVDDFTAFFVSLGIALLAPQFLKINAGHFALAYGLIFPLAILLLLRYLFNRSGAHFWTLLIFNCLLFLLHPYLGFCVAVFCFISLFLIEIIRFNKKGVLKNSISILNLSVLPLVLFKVFMYITDHHAERTTEPFGVEVMIENPDSILSPTFGPFRSLMENWFSNRTAHYEGHTYLGFFTILLTVLFIISLPFLFKKINIRTEALVIFIAAFFILLISFGVHLQIFEALHLKSVTLNQFRAVCRFAWLFYYVLPLFVVALLYHTGKRIFSETKLHKLFGIGSLLFFSSNLVEANYFFKLDESSYWQFRNIFHADYLNKEENANLALLKKNQVQAILPLPIFHGGSEMYDRLGSNNSMIPSMIYSYHSNIPILSAMLSRTSHTETKELIQVLNSYKKEKQIVKLFNKAGFFVINTRDSKLPDEERLIESLSFKGENDSLQFAFISKEELLRPKLKGEIFDLNTIKQSISDSIAIIFIEHEDRKPFKEASFKNYETIVVLDSNRFKTGRYVVSFHYYYTKKTYHTLACGLIITKTNTSGSEWQYNLPIRYMSGFYNGYGVFEYSFDLNKENNYEFILKGDLDETYRISHFLVRPSSLNTRFIATSKDTLYNNFSD